MKEGYTVIPNTDLHPEIDDNYDSSSQSYRSKIYFKNKAIAIAIAIALLIVLAVHNEKTTHLQQGDKKVKDIITSSVTDCSTNNSIIDSTCEYFVTPKLKFSTRNISFIQSSIESSNFWDEIECHTNIKDNEHITNREEKPEAEAVIYVDWNGDISSKKLKDFDSILGFGASFTESSSFNFKSLSKDGQDMIINLLFGKEGLGYALGRVPLNSCDFSLGNYNFDNIEDDFELKYFDENVTHDVQNGMIELITRANYLHSKSWHDNLKLIASPWSPPAWMKAPIQNNTTHPTTMDQTSFPVGLRNGTGVHSKYAHVWAKYISKFISSYKHHNISLWAVTVQNEPFYPAPWEACAYDKQAQYEFILYHLGPVLRNEHPGVNLLAYDFNKDRAPEWAQYLLHNDVASEEVASKYIDGIAMHFYGNTIDRQLDGKVGASNMHKVKQIITDSNSPTKKRFLLGTEACNCPSTGYNLQNKRLLFERAERYAHSILFDLAAGSQGWIEWNLL